MGTLDKLKKKEPVQRTVEVVVTDDSGEAEKIELIFQAIGSNAYDKLVALYPPTKAQKEKGAQYNVDKFAPALLAACCVDPQMTEEDATEIWESDAWSRGELNSLFLSAIEVNTRGHSLPPTKSG